MNHFTTFFTIVFILFGSMSIFAQGVAINTDGSAANNSAILDASSNSKGVLIPRMTLAERDNIASPSTELLIYQTDNTPGFYFYNGTAWVVVGDGATSINSLYDGKTGGHSVFLGNNSGTVDDGSDNWNTGIGEGVLPVNTAGSYNTVVGDRGMQSNETGWNNTAIGHKALYSNVLGNGNIAIGFEAGYNETGSNKLYIDNSNTDNPLIYGEFDNDNVTINGTLNVKGTAAINTDGSSADASAMLEVKSTDKGFLPPRMTQVQRNGITPTTGLMVYNTTTNKPNFYNGTEWMNYDGTSAEPAVGDFHQGGVVFYLDGSGGGLICAVSDQSTGTEWGCYNTGISGADGTAIGTGAQNTIDIEAGCATSGIAADICANLSLNGYDDWFLPSKDEISVMYQNRATINVTATANGGCSFCTADCYYWSSSEDSNSYAWLQGFDSDYHQYYYKYYLCYVRAVRAF